jgi:DNA-binding transcriptional MerR regulator
MLQNQYRLVLLRELMLPVRRSDRMVVRMPDETAPKTPIPEKLFFRIGEVSQIVGVEPYVLRYWESEFPGLSPRKSSTGQRMFRRKDVELLLNIRELLYEKKFTIEGARQALKAGKTAASEPRHFDPRQEEMFPPPDPLPVIRRELADILKLLS